MHSVRIGCSGWSYKDWRGRLYPRGLPSSRWLERYAEAFDTVEINATFYRLPKRETVAGWVERTPDGFLFAYLNNDWRGFAPANAVELRRGLSSA